MKRTILLLSATLLAAPAFAEDLCQINLQELDNRMVSRTPGAPLDQKIEDYREQARQAQARGDTKECISHTEKALKALQRTGTEGDSPS